MVVSQNGKTPKWMVYRNPAKIDDLGVPLFQSILGILHMTAGVAIH